MIVSFALAACGDDGALDSDVPIAAATEEVFVAGGDASGEEWALFSRISALAFTMSGDLALLDARRKRIVVVASDGSLRREIPRPGEAGRLGSADFAGGHGRWAVAGMGPGTQGLSGVRYGRSDDRSHPSRVERSRVVERIWSRAASVARRQNTCDGKVGRRSRPSDRSIFVGWRPADALHRD